MKEDTITNSIKLILFFIYFSSNHIFAQANDSQNEKYLILLNPKGTEIYEHESDILIEWESQNIDKIGIEYLNDYDKWKSIISEIEASERKFVWKIDSEIPRLIKLRITDIADTNISDITPFFIEIQNPDKKILNKVNNELKKSTSLIPIKIMPLGNSITQGYTVPVPIERDGYRKSLKLLTENNGLNFDFVGSESNGSFFDNQHEGHGGYSAKHWANNPKFDLSSKIITYLTPDPKPDIVLLHIGTNDINEYKSTGNDNTIDTTVAAVSGILDLIYSVDPNIIVILAKIVNRIDDSVTTSVNESETTSLYNIALGIMANTRMANGDNLILVDMENALIYPNDLSDWAHPKLSGYEKMANVWFDAIKSLMPKINAKIYLEGVFFAVDSMTAKISSTDSFPKENPYNIYPWNYSGTEKVTIIPNNVVDWVLVSLRSDTSASSTVAQRAAFLKSDGSIVDLDGSSPVAFAVDQGSYYAVIEHRNHLPVMSSIKIPIAP